MLKVLIWQVSEDTAFKDKALKILEQQNDGIEIVASMSNNDITKIEWGGGVALFSSSAQKKSA